MHPSIKRDEPHPILFLVPPLDWHGWPHALQPLLWWMDVEMGGTGRLPEPCQGCGTHLPQPSPMQPDEQRQIFAIHPFEVVFSSQAFVGSQITPVLLP